MESKERVGDRGAKFNILAEWIEHAGSVTNALQLTHQATSGLTALPDVLDGDEAQCNDDVLKDVAAHTDDAFASMGTFFVPFDLNNVP